MPPEFALSIGLLTVSVHAGISLHHGDAVEEFPSDHEGRGEGQIHEDRTVAVLIRHVVALGDNPSLVPSAGVSFGKFRTLEGAEGKNPSKVDSAPIPGRVVSHRVVLFH